MSADKNLGGAPRKSIDLAQVERLASLHCVDAEIGSVLGISCDTLARRKKDDPAFAEALDRGRAKGRASLRQLQWAQAQDGAVGMAAFLGKQVLGQRDRWGVDNRQIGPDGRMISPGQTFVLSIER